MVAPDRYRKVSSGMGCRVSPFRNAFEMLERYAVKVARTVLRGGSGSNATPLPDQRTAEIRAQKWLGGCLYHFPVFGHLLVPPAAANASRWAVITGECFYKELL